MQVRKQQMDLDMELFPNKKRSVPTLNEACVQEKRNQAKKSASLKDHERLG